MEERKQSGIFNLGSGEARTFLDLVNAVFDSMGLEPNIEFIDTPEDIRDTYQYFTEAEMGKIKEHGYQNGFLSIEKGVLKYVKFLQSNKFA